MSGSTFTITAVLKTIIANLSGPVVPQNNFSVSTSTIFTIKKNPLVANITITNYLNQQINPLQIGFLEPNFTLNASSSFDPDNSSAILNYTWTCPTPIDSTTCGNMQNGVRNNSLTFPLWLKFKASLQYGVNYAFIVVVQNVNNPYSVSASLAFNVAFALPATNDSVTVGITPTKCEQL